MLGVATDRLLSGIAIFPEPEADLREELFELSKTLPDLASIGLWEVVEQGREMGNSGANSDLPDVQLSCGKMDYGELKESVRGITLSLPC